LGLGTTNRTMVWGYGGRAQQDGLPAATYPGRTFEVRRKGSTRVFWTNNLDTNANGTGKPLPHLLPIDSTIHWADPLRQGHVVGPYRGPVPVVTHLHGGLTQSASDGLPDQWFTPGFRITGPAFKKANFKYTNDPEATTIWYHDHALGITRLNVYAGLAGFYIVRDGNEDRLIAANYLPPSGLFDIPVVIQDRMFTDDGQLFYPSELNVGGAPNPSIKPEFFGNIILCNGKAWPKLEVERREYRIRLLNGSDSRFYRLYFEPDISGKVFQIGTDQGLLNRPVQLSNGFVLGPGERRDLVIKFTGLREDVKQIFLRNDAPIPFPDGNLLDDDTRDILRFDVIGAANPPSSMLPIDVNLRPRHGPIEDLRPFVKRTRKLALFEGEDEHGRIQPLLGVAVPTKDATGNTVNGSLHFADPITEAPRLNDVEIWEIYNSTVDAHPIHLHLARFQILDRQPFTAQPVETLPPTGGIGMMFTVDPATTRIGTPRLAHADERGWKDTATMYPGEVTRIIAKFDKPGDYVWHCHILSHEDNDMMRPYRVRP
jgi:spore coat protein A, manganese oxidase